MYSSHMLDSDTFFGVHPIHGGYQTYSSYPNFTPRSMSPRDRYYHALVEAHFAKLEILEGVRREEILLQRRLQGLRQARVEQLLRDYLHAPYSIGHTSVDFLPYNRSNVETLGLRLQEEEELAQLAALQGNLLELQGGSLRARSFTGHPCIKHLHSQRKPIQSGNLATGFDVRRSHPTMFAVNQTKEGPKLPFQSCLNRQNEPRIESTPFDLDGILAQLGLSALQKANHQHVEKSIHQPKGSNGREEISEIQSQDLAETRPFNKVESPKQEKHEKRPSQASQSLNVNLKEQLEKRLNAEHESEVRDTIEAVLHSLYDTWPTSMGAKTSSTQSPRPSTKGKEKENTSSPKSNKLSSSEVIDNASFQIKEIEKQFCALEREFMFPTNLDFIAPIPTKAGSTPATSYLSFTASNQPIRFFEQSLSQLLIKLDLIESQGNEELRNKRKDVVQKVEHALEDLEKEVEQRLKAKLASEYKRRSVTIEDVTSPDEHLGAELVSSSPLIDVKTDRVNGPSHPTPGVVSDEITETLSSPSTQVAIDEPTITPNSVDEESPNQDLGNRECIAAESDAWESILQIDSSETVPPKTSANSPVQPPISLGLEYSEPKEARAPEGLNSDPNTTSEEPVDQIQIETVIQEHPSAEPLNAATAVLPASAGSDTWTQDATNEAEKKRLSDEETSDISEVESISSDWSEVGVAVA